MSSSGSDDDKTAPTRLEKRRAAAGRPISKTVPLPESKIDRGAPDDTGEVTLDGAAPAADDPLADIAAELGGPLKLPDRFEVRGRLGKGGMAVVLRVHDSALGRDVAVKLLPHTLSWDATNRARFEREARAAAMLRHPGLVTVHDIDVEHGFIVMELVRGESLRDRLRREGPQPPEEVRRIGTAILEALHVAHEAGIVHRDVKPGNVLLSEQGDVKLADFGIASFGDSDLTTTGRHVGTPAYMPPEQLRGRNVDARADVYATGATLFEASTGRRLHDEDTSVEQPMAVVQEATGDTALAAAVATAVYEKPEDRFHSALDFAQALQDPARAHALPVARPGSSAGRRRAAWWMAAVLVATVFTTGTFLLLQRGDGDDVADTATAAPAPEALPPNLALLPFVDKTGDPRLDFAAAGLPHLMGMEMRRVPGANVIGYYRLLEHVSSPDAPATEWTESARKLGAERLVEGTLSKGAHGIHVEVAMKGLDGAVLTRLARDVPTEEVPEAARRMAAEIAALSVGRPVELSARAPRPLDLERSLQLGIAALERHELGRAESELKAVLAENPELGEARYYLTLALWWRGASREETLAEVEAALATDVTEAQRGFLEGMKLFISWRREESTEHFQRLAERYPRDRDILYGLFEALYHGGHTADAVAVYRTVCEISPSFRLGLVHALTYYTARTDEKGMEWALARAGVLGDSPRDIWGAKMLMSRRDMAGAIELLRRVSTATGSEAEVKLARWASEELVRAYAVHGELDLALSLARRLTEEGEYEGSTMALRGLHILRGDPGEMARWRERATREAAMSADGFPRINTWLEVLLLELPDAPREHFQEIFDAVKKPSEDWIERMEFYRLGRVFLARRLERWSELEEATRSSYPEVSAVAQAFLAEHRGDLGAAAAAWRLAIASVGNGRYLPLELSELARVVRASGDHAATLEACRNTMLPPLFDWSWAAHTSPCAVWYGEAAAALGRAHDARWGWERLLRWRTTAPPGDPLVAAARAGLADLDGD